MCTCKRISAKMTHISAKEPHCAPWGGVKTCLQVCVHVSCITICLPICTKKIWSEKYMRLTRALHHRKEAPLCTLMRSVTWPIHKGEIILSHERHDSLTWETRLTRLHVRSKLCASSAERAQFVLKHTHTLSCPCVLSVSVRSLCTYVGLFIHVKRPPNDKGIDTYAFIQTLACAFSSVQSLPKGHTCLFRIWVHDVYEEPECLCVLWVPVRPVSGCMSLHTHICFFIHVRQHINESTQTIVCVLSTARCLSKRERGFQNWYIFIENSDLRFQTLVVGKSLYKFKDTYVCIQTLPARFQVYVPSQRDTYVFIKNVSTPHVPNRYIHGPSGYLSW